MGGLKSQGGIRFGIVAALVGALLLPVGCASPDSPATLASTGDPMPVDFGRAHSIDSEGGRIRDRLVVIDADAGVVPNGHEILVSVGRRLGEASSPYTEELFGTPVRVDHDVEILEPLTLEWDISELSEIQRNSMVLVRWDESTMFWTPTSEPLEIEGNTARARVSEFSIISWTAISDWVADNITQNVGAVLGNRADAPECSSDPVPEWVRLTVRPDEEMDAVALRTCFEPDVDGRLTLRVANNRSFAQRLTHTDGGQTWAWVWAGDEDLSPEGVVYSVAASFFGSDNSLFLPPTREVAVGLARPNEPGVHHIELTSRVDGITVSADIIAHLFGQVPVGGLSNPLANAFVQVLYECGGHELLSQPNLTDPRQVVGTSLRTVKSCSTEILRPDSDLGRRFEELSRALIAKGGSWTTSAVQANRMVRQVAGAMKYLEVANLSWYVSDQFAEGAVGPTMIALNASGQPQVLGEWTPSCTNADTDSNLLYRNLALQDQFADTAYELWEFPGWTDAAKSAVAPLRQCSMAQREQLASLLVSDWGDPTAAEIVARAIRSLEDGGGQSAWRYQNPRFGFSLEVPSMLIPGDLPANGDGWHFLSEDGQATLLAFGSNNVFGESATEACDELMRSSVEGGSSVTYNRLSGETCTISGVSSGGDVFYVRKVIGTGSVVTLSWEYPVSQAELWREPLERSVATFDPGDVSETH